MPENLLQKITILDQRNSLLNQFMAELRDVKTQKDGARFRANLEKIGQIMAYEISQTLPFQKKQIKTPLGYHPINLMVEHPILMTIFRAGIPFYQGFLNYFDRSKSGFIGAQRSEPSDNDNPIDSVVVKMGYHVIPDIHEKIVIIIDPMLATGNSMLNSIHLLLQKGTPKMLYVACVIAAPEGIEFFKQHVPVVFEVWTASLDERLDESAFIYPGLGDAGDLSFGSGNSG